MAYRVHLYIPALQVLARHLCFCERPPTEMGPKSSLAEERGSCLHQGVPRSQVE